MQNTECKRQNENNSKSSILNMQFAFRILHYLEMKTAGFSQEKSAVFLFR
jgi:hypothetical protein